MKTIGDKPRIRIIRMRKVPFMDTNRAAQSGKPLPFIYERKNTGHPHPE